MLRNVPSISPSPPSTHTSVAVTGSGEATSPLHPGETSGTLTPPPPRPQGAAASAASGISARSAVEPPPHSLTSGITTPQPQHAGPPQASRRPQFTEDSICYGSDSVPKAGLLPGWLSVVRETAAAAVAADGCGEHAQAAELYHLAGRRLLSHAATMRASSDRAAYAAALQMADQYLQRAGVLRDYLAALRKGREQAEGMKKPFSRVDGGSDGADYWDPDCDESGSLGGEDHETLSDGEVRTKKNRRLSFRAAAKLVLRLVSVPFPGMRRAFSAQNFGGKTVQTHCKITKRKFLGLDELSPAAATALVPLYKMGSPHVLWACYCLKRSVYHRKFAKTKVDRRTAVLSPQAFYMGAQQELVRCLPIGEITQVVVSTDSWVALIVPGQYDILFQPQEKPIQTINTFLEILLELSKHYAGLEGAARDGKPGGEAVKGPLRVMRINSQIDYTRLELCPPATWDVPPFVPLKVDIIEKPPEEKQQQQQEGQKGQQPDGASPREKRRDTTLSARGRHASVASSLGAVGGSGGVGSDGDGHDLPSALKSPVTPGSAGPSGSGHGQQPRKKSGFFGV